MNRYLQEKWSWIEGSHAMRIELLGALSEADLRFNPGGANKTLGALFRESGDRNSPPHASGLQSQS